MTRTATIDLGTELAEGPCRDFNTARKKPRDRFEEGFELANEMQRAANARLIAQRRPRTTQRHTYKAAEHQQAIEQSVTGPTLKRSTSRREVGGPGQYGNRS